MSGALRLRLALVEGSFAILRRPAASAWPDLSVAPAGEFFSATRTSDELSIVASEPRARALDDQNPSASDQLDAGWRMFRVEGTMDLSLVGAMAALAVPLARAGVSLFPLATFDTDYLLVRESQLDAAFAALAAAGHLVTQGAGSSSPN